MSGRWNLDPEPSHRWDTLRNALIVLAILTALFFAGQGTPAQPDYCQQYMSAPQGWGQDPNVPPECQ